MKLTNKLSIYILSLAAIIFCGLGFVYFRYGTSREESRVTLYASLLVENRVEKLEYQLSDIENHIAEYAPSIDLHSTNKAKLAKTVEKIISANPTIMGGCVAFLPGAFANDSDSLFMAYVSRGSDDVWQCKYLGNEQYNYTTMDWYCGAVSAGHGTWSEPYFDKGGGETMMTTYTLPLRDAAGDIKAVLTADVSIDEIIEEFDNLRPIDGSYSVLLSRKGVYIEHPDSTIVMNTDIYSRADLLANAQLRAIGKEMTAMHKGYQRINMAGKDMLAVYQPITRTGWSVCAMCPYDSITAELGTAISKALIILFLSLIVLALLIRVIVVCVVRPIKRLTNAAEEIASGNLDASLPSMKVNDEVGKLNDAFAGMQTALREQMQRLVDTTRDKQRIESELQIAREIQMSLLPRRFPPYPEAENLEVFASLNPAKEVGGDFYDFFIRDGKLFFTIGDVSGKGVPAALLMAVAITMFRVVADTCNSPSTILTRINDTIIKGNDNCMFVTMFIGVLDLKSGHMKYCNAGHDAPIIITDKDTREIAAKANIPIGVFDGFEYEEESLTIPIGHKLFLYTDGLTEAENADKRLFGFNSLTETLSKCCADSTRESIGRMNEAVKKHVGDVEQSDDLTMLCLRLTDYKFIKEFNLKGDDTALAELPEIATQIAAQSEMADDAVGKLNLVLEEIVANQINYAFQPGDDGVIRVKAAVAPKAGWLHITITDNGKPFDPTAAKEADTEASTDERQIGGLGIHLVKSLSDDMSYLRKSKQNILRISFRTK